VDDDTWHAPRPPLVRRHAQVHRIRGPQQVPAEGHRCALVAGYCLRPSPERGKQQRVGRLLLPANDAENATIHLDPAPPGHQPAHLNAREARLARLRDREQAVADGALGLGTLLQVGSHLWNVP